MTRTLTVRLDDETDQMLTEMASGRTQSEVVRDLIRHAGAESLAAEVARLRADPVDIAACAEVARDMEALRAR